MKMDKVILVGNAWNIFELFSRFINIVDYIKYYVGDDAIIEPLNCKPLKFLYTQQKTKCKVVVDNRINEFNEIKSILVRKYHISPNRIIEMKDWLADILEHDENCLLFSSRIRLDFCTLCQLNCKDCYMRKDDYGTVGRGYLKFEVFKKFIDDNPFIKEIEISNNGEVFLNPEIDQIFEYAIEKNISLFLKNGTNFNYVKDSTLELMVKANMPYITFSIDGACNETYQQYRVNGNFDKVIENIKKLNNYKEKYKSETPKLIWQFIVMEHNVHEIKNVIDMARELKMQTLFKREWSYTYVPKKISEVEKLTGLNYRNVEKDKFYNSLCLQMIFSPQINWDGRLLGCCLTYKSDWKVNAFDNGLINALNSSEYRKGLITLLRAKNKNNKTDGINPCTDCNIFKNNEIMYHI